MSSNDGPASDHFNGTHFFDPDGVPPKSLGEVLRWQFGGGRKRATWPDWAPSPHADTPPARVDGDKVRLSFVGHVSWLIQTAGLNILIDPVWSERVSPLSFAGPKRRNDPGIAFDALPRIDVVLVSHGHYDHLDAPTLSRLAATFTPRVITPLGNDCGRVLSWRRPPAKSTSSAIPAMARERTSAAWRKRMGRCGSRSCRSAPMSRAGSCATST